MKSLAYVGALGVALGSFASPVSAESPAAAVTTTSRPMSAAFHSFQIHLGLESGGPVLFKDTPDGRLEPTTVFEYGGHLGFLFGDELLDLHRFGLGLAFDTAAVSDSRHLRFVTPELMYEIGHPLVLQLGLGWAAGVGTKDFAEHYSGYYSGAALRYSFRRADNAQPVSVSIGLTGKVVVASESLDRSTAFVGAEVELIFHKMDPGGAL